MGITPTAIPSRKTQDPPLNLVLVEPEIPPNTGNVARLTAATGCHLVLIGQLGFELSDRTLKRAGLDYWPFVSWEHHPNLTEYLAGLAPGSFHLLTTKSTTPYTHIPVCRGDHLIFGKETQGLPIALLEQYPKQCYTIPMQGQGVRSINLSSAVAAVAFDCLRRIEGF